MYLYFYSYLWSYIGLVFCILSLKTIIWLSKMLEFVYLILHRMNWCRKMSWQIPYLGLGHNVISSCAFLRPFKQFAVLHFHKFPASFSQFLSGTKFFISEVKQVWFSFFENNWILQVRGLMALIVKLLHKGFGGMLEQLLQ